MSTYFNNKKSNIEKLTKREPKKKDKLYINKKDNDDKNADAEDANDKKIVEGFDTNPKSNIFGSSSNDTNDKDKEDDKTTNPKSKPDSTTSKALSSQLDPSSILIFCFHALLSVLFVYIWGALATNAIYLISESDNNLDYILPIDEYKPPYTNNGNKDESWCKYGFPYDLGEGRIVSPTAAMSDKFNALKKRQKDTTFYLLLSEEGKQNDKNKEGFSNALTQYIFEAVYGGLGKGGRKIIRIILGILKVTGSDPDKSTWTGMMENRTALKVAAFIIWPFFMLQFLIPFVAIWSGITTIGYGILQNHIFWGIIFTLIIGMFVAMANGFYMAMQTFYIFFIYPWAKEKRHGEWKDIFNNLKTYMLLAFYFIICFYGYEDLGASGGAGIMLIVIVSIVLQYRQNKKS
jgi:hypothetical protein